MPIEQVVVAENSVRGDTRLIAFSAAAMYGSAAFLSFVDGFIPGGPSPSIALGVAAVLLVVSLLAAGPRLPRAALALLGPVGVVLIAVALATGPGPGDGAVLYMWPVLWTSFFFGRRGAVAIVGLVAAAHALVLVALPAADGYWDRWVDVTVSVSVVAAVVRALARRNDRLLDRLAGEARTDALTGLLNRRGFDERAAIELAHARREGTALAVVSLDLDHFKRINDEWGHDTGDTVLRELGAVLMANAREVDVVARVGGEEFAVLLPGALVAEAVGFTERIRKAVAPGSADTPATRFSAGVAASPSPESIEALLHAADSALYTAKRSGRDRTSAFTEIALSA